METAAFIFTEGILKNPVKRNYQYEYAVRLRNKNIWLYHDKHRIVKHNIAELTDTLRKSLNPERRNSDRAFGQRNDRSLQTVADREKQ